VAGDRQIRVAAAFLAIFAACAGAPGERPAPAWTDVVAAPLAREVAIDVSPSELADPAALERMRHRVRLKRIGRAWLRGDALPINDGAADDGEPIDEILPAVGETANRIRVVVEEDDARVAVWIDRRDAWETIVAPVRLGLADEAPPAGAWLTTGTGGATAAGSGGAAAGSGGAAAGSGGAAAAGVWLEAGAPIRAPRGPAGARQGRTVELRDEGVAVRGVAPGAFVGHVWIVPHDDRTKTAMASGCSVEPWQPRAAHSALRSLGEGTAIRAAAGEAAPVLATSQERLDAVVLSGGGGWTLVEVRRPYARIRGYVPSLALDPADDGGLDVGACGTHGFGMSHADRIEVPAGTCLFDHSNGEVIGAAIKTKVRLGASARAGADWSMVYVDTRWSLASLYVHDTGRDPAQPAFESCAPGRHRR
jgi:hypothetical protein